MKKIIASLALAGVVGFLAACGSTTPAPSVTVTATATETQKVESTVTETAPAPAPRTVEPEPTQENTNTLGYKDSVFVDAIRKNYSGSLDSVSDAQIIKLGKTMCTSLDKGNSIEDIILAAGDTIGYQNAGLFIGAAVPVYCPEHTGLVKKFLKDNSPTI